MDTAQYLDVFIDESMEHLDVLYNQLLVLEKNPSEHEVIEEIFRAAHTIKGMAATMGFEDIANLTHNLENVFDGIRDGNITVQVQTIDVLFGAVDHLNIMVEDLASGGEGKGDVKQILEHLKNIESGHPHQPIEKEVSDDPRGETQLKTLDEFEMAILNESFEQGYTNYEIVVNIRKDCLLKGVRAFMVFETLEKLGEIIKSEPSVNDLEEEKFDDSFIVLFVTKVSSDEINQKINQISEIEHVKVQPFSLSDFKAEKDKVDDQDPQESQEKQQTNQNTSLDMRQAAPRQTIRVNIERLNALMNLFEEFVIDRGRLEQIATEINHRDLKETVEHISRTSTDLQNIILNMRMVPISQVFNRFPGMIRQTARDLNKNINLEITGAETELDRTVIDEIGDPLVHLLRNAADHGIELPDVRKKKGKPEQGVIKLGAFHSGNFMIIEIEDDGAGIDQETVLKKAISSGVISTEQSEMLEDQQIYELIMDSGFSTSEVVSDISGRGVGLDVVKNTIETLGGSITINSQMDQGTKFSIQLPLTLSIISVLLVGLQDEKYAIPLSSIVETIRVSASDISEIHHNKVLDYRGKVVPLVFLNKIFSVPIVKEDGDYVAIVIVQRGDKLAGLVVDSFIGQQEVVIKSLGNYLRDIPAISGATILGDGEVALIIDSNALIKS